MVNFLLVTSTYTNNGSGEMDEPDFAPTLR